MASPSPTVETVAPLATGECDDNYTDVSSKPWADTMQWWFHSSTTPPTLSVTEVVTDLRAGTQNITHEVNTCGRPDTVSATSNYNGSNTLPVNITNDGVCASHGDGTSEVGFGTLPSNFIAATCNWANLFFRTESDIRFNKNSIYTFTTGSCSGQFSSSYYVEGSYEQKLWIRDLVKDVAYLPARRDLPGGRAKDARGRSAGRGRFLRGCGQR